MKFRFLYILMFTLSVMLFSQQATSTNYRLLDYGLFNGNLSGSSELTSANYIAKSNIVGGNSGGQMSSANYNNLPGYYLGSLTSDILPPEDVTITVENDSTRISWTAVTGASSYKVYSSSNPYDNFTEDTSGGLSGTIWSTLFVDQKKFYYVIALK